jgi:purine nucleoside permease
MFRKIGLAFAWLSWIATPGLGSAQTQPVAPKVLVITMFGGEAKPWLDGEALTRKIAVPGSPRPFPRSAAPMPGFAS